MSIKQHLYSRRFLKKALFWTAIILFVVWLSRLDTDLEQVVETLSQGSPYLLTLAFSMELIFLLLMTFHYHYVFKILGYPKRFLEMFEKNMANIFFNVLTPAGGVGGMAYLAQVLSSKRGVSFGGNLVGVFTMLASYYIGFFMFAVPSVFYLTNINGYISSTGIIALSIFTVYNLVLISTIVLAIFKPLRVKYFFFKFKSIYQKLGRIKEGSLLALSDEILDRNLNDFTIASKVFTNRKTKLELINVQFLGVFGNVLQICILYVVFLAFDVQVDVIDLVVIYVLFYLFTVVSPTPQGVGFVEGVIQIAMVSLGYGGGDAFIVTMSYRLITAWMPVLLGLIFFRKLNWNSQSRLETLDSSLRSLTAG